MARWSTQYYSEQGYDCTIELEHDDYKVLLKMADELMHKMAQQGIIPIKATLPSYHQYFFQQTKGGERNAGARRTDEGVAGKGT